MWMERDADSLSSLSSRLAFVVAHKQVGLEGDGQTTLKREWIFRLLPFSFKKSFGSLYETTSRHGVVGLAENKRGNEALPRTAPATLDRSRSNKDCTDSKLKYAA